jgi:hypothetical protein
MIAHTTSSVNYAALEKEWLSLSSPEEKFDFWKRMKLLFADLDPEQVNYFFEQLQKSANDITLRLELATKRAEMFGFKPNAS